MTREEAIKILRREIECLSHTKCEDCILEVACNPIITTPYDSEYIEVYEMAISALSENKGEWIKMGEAYVCSRCSTACACTEMADKWIWHTDDKFCRGCGANMRGD